jgi:chromosome segregation ATPase
MSLTNDAVNVFRNTLLSVIQKPEAKLPAPPEEPLMEQPSPPTAPTLLEQSLLAVARDSADIRRDHDAILTKAAALGTLQEDLLAVFDRAYQALEQLAEARSQLSKAEAVAKFEREAREAAAQRLASMTASYHQSVSEVERLRPETRRLETSLSQTSERLARVEAENGTLAEQLAETKAEIERKISQEALARRDLEAAKTELAAANAYAAQKIAEMSQLHERCEIAEQAARASTRALEESRGECANALVRLDEERVNLASAESRVTALETQLRDLGDKFSAAGAAWSQEAERFNETVARLKDELAQANGRDEAHQRLLASAQSELAALRRQCGDLESQLGESRLNASQLLTRAEGSEAARDAMAADLATSKRLHQSLMRRVKPMIAALREKNAESVKLAATLSDMERRFLNYQADAGETIRVLQDREMQLVADLEAERARRVVAEGSLAIDRSFRQTETQRKTPDAP